MIIVAELQMQGNKHVQVNSGLIQILTLVFKKQDMQIFCDTAHQDELLKYIPNVASIEFIPFKFTGSKELKKINTLKKVYRETALAFKIYKKSKESNPEFIIFASAFPFTALFLNLFSWIFKQKTIICLHGDIGILSLKKHKVTTWVFRNAIKLFFRFRSTSVTALFYGQSIKDKLFKMFPDYDKRNVICIDHPYNYDNFPNASVETGTTIASIGTSLMSKNSHFLYKVSELQKQNVLSGKVKFMQVGYISAEVNTYFNQYVKIIGNQEFLPFEVFEENVKKANYFIYFFLENSLYDLCPSGSFFDAIKYRKPIISLHNPFFDYYFEKLGNIGYLCNSLSEMNDVINRILTGNDGDYVEQVEALKKASELLSIENIATSFQKEYLRLTKTKNG